MDTNNKENFIPPGPSRGQTRDPGIFLDKGNISVKKLLCQKTNFRENFKIYLNKYSLCKDKRCKCCPLAGVEQIEGNRNLFCKASNVVYYFECSDCNLGYVGQTSNSLNIRINGHRSDIKNVKNNYSNDIEIKHFQLHDFNKVRLYILEVVSELDYRIKVESRYMCKLNSIYPYGLNSIFNFSNLNDECVYTKFILSKVNNVFKRGCRGSGKNKSKVNILDVLNGFNLLEFNFKSIKDIKALIFRLKNKDIIWFLRNKVNDYVFNNLQIKDIVFDLFKYKLKCKSLSIYFKPVEVPLENLIVHFNTKYLDNINFNELIKNCVGYFPLKNDFQIRIAFTYGKTLKKLICNYNVFSKNLDLIKEKDCMCNIDKYNEFVNPDYGHIVTGNLNIVEDVKLRNLMKLGSKFRMDFNNSSNKIIDTFEKDLDIFILKISYKYVWPIEDFFKWKLEMIKKFKNNFLFYINFYKIKKDKNDLKSLFKSIKVLKDKFIISTVDKADNNFSFICKTFYKKLLLHEYSSNYGFKKLNCNVKEINNRISAYNKILKLRISNFTFPYLFITTKFHKNPVKFRFVTCGTFSYSYYAGKIFFNLLNKILNVINEKGCFVINNNKPVIKYINNNCNKIKTIDTYDFENLFGSIPHNDILEICSIIYDEFSNVLKCEKNYWINLTKFCIFENILFNGTNYFVQKRGIPMGSSFSSAFANIYLYYFENKMLNYNHVIFRYIDDIIVFNSDDFIDIANTFYPKDLVLKHTNSDRNSISFLDLKIDRINDKWSIGIYDKRLDFNFEVNSMTSWNSCISIKVLKNILYAQIARIKDICNNGYSIDTALSRLIEIAKKNNYPTYILTNISCN